MRFFQRRRFRWLGMIAILLGGCQSRFPAPIATVPHVDLARFMGSWYVIACIPTFIEKNAYGPVESYQLNADGTIATTFTLRDGAFDGKEKKYQPRGYVMDRQTNAVWGMQFVWPIKADYRIVHVADDYSQTVVGREKRDYVWIMARTPSIPDADYQRLLKIAEEQGYTISRIKKMPQR